MTPDPIWLIPLFLTGGIAGFVDSIAGGGGLLTLPVLLNLGLPPHVALGTNKLQASFGSTGAAWFYSRAGWIRWSDCFMGVAITGFASVAGAWAVLRRFDPQFLRWLIPWMLLAIALFLLAKPRFGDRPVRPRMTPGLFHLLFGALLGFYDGFFGPGTGTFWTMAYLGLLGLDMPRATAHTKAMNAASNLGSLLLFLSLGQIWWEAGAVMGIGQILGARLGSRAVIRSGTRLVRPAIITIAILLCIRILWVNLT